MNILITGGTGTVGRRVTGLLAQRGVRPRVLVRSLARLDVLGGTADGVVGDLKDQHSVRAAMRGVDRLFLITPHSQTEADEGLGAVRAAIEAGVKRIVYLSAHGLDDTPDDIPHLASKKVIHRAIAASGIEHTVVMPNNFYQNDDNWFREPLMKAGLYTQPIGPIGLSRVDADDIAVAVVRVLLEDGHAGRYYGLVGPDVLTGEKTTALWAEALGRPVRYAGDDLEAWAAGGRGSFPDWLLDDLVRMYAFFQRAGVRATPQDLADTKMLLGRPPKSFAEYANEAARRWRRAA